MARTHIDKTKGVTCVCVKDQTKKKQQNQNNDTYTYRQNKGHDMCLYKGLDTNKHINSIHMCNSTQTNKTNINDKE